jgi:hypothetical protein
VKTRVRCQAESTKVILLILLVACWAATFPPRLCSQPAGVLSSTKAPVASGPSVGQDPNKPASELNHHLAGYALIAIGVLVIAGQSSDRLRPLQYVWPFLFVLAGLFLAAWSDGEIWPRGNLNWIWLIHHDAEARQHKIYALLLMVMGTIEYLRARAKLSRFWRTWAFPLLALVGVVLLLFHDHTAGSGASSPEARKYVVSWLVNATTKTAASPAMDRSDPPPAMHDHMGSPGSVPLETQRPQAEVAAHEGMEMHSGSNGHQHPMTAAMLSVERQHLWFALIGVAVVLFKFIHDSALSPRSFIPFLWPSCVAVLGILLVFYTE